MQDINELLVRPSVIIQQLGHSFVDFEVFLKRAEIFTKSYKFTDSISSAIGILTS